MPFVKTFSERTRCPFQNAIEKTVFCAVLQPVMPAEVVDAAVAGMNAVRAGQYDTGCPPENSRWTPGDDPQTLCKIEMPQLASRAIMDLVAHPALGKLAAEVTGAKMVQVWWVQLLYKPVGEPKGERVTNIGWHQDRYYWRAWEDGSELFTAWIALSDITPDAGPMRFVPGSHRWGLLDIDFGFQQQDLDTLRGGIANSRTRNVARSAHVAAARRVEPARLLHPARQRAPTVPMAPAAALPFTCGAKNRARSTTCGRA